jgi:hypothetical protein
VEFGWGDNTISEPRYPHEIVNFFVFGRERIIEKCIPLYEKGYSLAQVSDMTGAAASSIFETMKRHKRVVRSASAARKTNPPFGYAWLSGKLVMDPNEYKTIELIKTLYGSGMRPYHIEKHLNAREIPTRKGGRWYARMISSILKRELVY